MIQGVVNAALQPVVSLAFQGPTGRRTEIEAIVDTGFSEFLMVPPALVAELGVPPVARTTAILADGGAATFEVYRATVLWDGCPRHIDAFVSDNVPLVGIRLLNRHTLIIEVENGGRVLIQAGKQPR